jgi:hypothetical protein
MVDSVEPAELQVRSLLTVRDRPRRRRVALMSSSRQEERLE